MIWRLASSGKGVSQVTAAQPRLDMRYRDLRVKPGERSGHCRGRVALDENEVRPAVCKTTAECPQQVASGIRQRPVDRLDVQFTVRGEPKRGQRGAADFAVLPRSDDADLKIVSAFSKCFYDRREFDRFGAGPHDDIAAYR